MKEIRSPFGRRTERLSRHDDNRHFRPGLVNQPHGLETVHPWHENIDDQEVEPPGFQQSQAGMTIIDGLDGMRARSSNNWTVLKTAWSSSMTRMLATSSPQ